MNLILRFLNTILCLVVLAGSWLLATWIWIQFNGFASPISELCAGMLGFILGAIVLVYLYYFRNSRTKYQKPILRYDDPTEEGELLC